MSALQGVKSRVRQWLLARRSLVGLVMLFNLCFLVTSGAILWELRRQTWDSAMRAAENLVAAEAQDIERNVELYNLSLLAVIDGLKLPGIDQVSPNMRQAILFDRAATARYLGSILRLDEFGNVMDDANSTPARTANFADRTYFTAHRDTPGLGLYVSEPFRRRLTGAGDWVIAFSRRIDKPDGSFGGVVSSTLRLDYFNALFSRLRLGRNSAVTVLRKDGTLLVRSPVDDAIIGRRFVGTDVMRHLLEAPSGEFTAKTELGGVMRTITFSHIAELPLMVFVAQSPGNILNGWNRWAITILAVLTFMGLVTTLLAKLAHAELRRRFAAEAEIKRREEQLRLISDHATDVIVRLDASMVRRYVSPSCRNVFGQSPDELLGHDFRNTMHPDDRARATHALEEARRQEGRTSLVYRILHKNGRMAYVESQFSFMPGDGGFTVLVRDITARKAVERDLAQAHDDLERLAATDGLTGLANRRCFDGAMLGEWRRAAREERPLTLLLLDVDHFKQFNDRYGHQKGDACLQAVARSIAGCARRSGDLAARYGGEEFVVLLPDTEVFNAAALAERVRQAVQDAAIPHAGNPSHHGLVTVSVGCHTVIPGPCPSGHDVEDDITDFITACDQALYAAKKGGRNRVAVPPPSVAVPPRSPVSVENLPHIA